MRFRIFIVGLLLLGLLIVVDTVIVAWSVPVLPAVAATSARQRALLGGIVEPLIHPQVPGTNPAVVTPPGPRSAATHPDRSLASFAALPFINAAFVVQDDPQSVADLRDHLRQVQMVFPDYLSFSTGDGNIVCHVDANLAALLASGPAMVLPRLSNTDERGNWRTDELRELFKDPDAADIFIDQTIAALERIDARGVNLDIEGLDAADKDLFVAWLDNFTDALHVRKFAVTVDVPMNDAAFDLEAIAGIADAVLLMAYDQHFATGSPGPIAAQPWFTEGLDDVIQAIDPRKLIVGLGAYGYDWKTGQRQARALSFSEAMTIAGLYGAHVETELASVNSHFNYTDDAGIKHQVWLLDAVCAWNQYHAARQAKVRGVALWRTGQEEPAVWSFLGGEHPGQFAPRTLAAVNAPDVVSINGDGEFLRVQNTARNGQRDLTFDGDFIDYASYDTLPFSFEVEQLGRGSPTDLALTFDDGPDPQWTPAILDMLARNHAKAAFFVVGSQGERFPELLVREFAEGHLIGNHTFSHPDLSKSAPGWLRIELNSTQRLIEAKTGRSTTLFRAPYDTDTQPVTLAQLAPLRQVTQMGYIIVGAGVDSEDYTRPGVDRIVANVLGILAVNHANILVFHDAGGDRSQTVAAVDRLIPLLRGKGYRMVGLDQLLRQSRDSLMPAVAAGENTIVNGGALLVNLHRHGWQVIVVLFAATTLISMGRIVMLGFLVLGSARRARRSAPAAAAFEPEVTAIIPAYNEGKVIGRTLQALLAGDYPKLSVMVVDDGSTDNTSDVVKQWRSRDSRVELITQANAGKSDALNRAFARAGTDYIVTIDADTIVHRQTVRRLIEPFADNSVDAVCGNVQVGNVSGLLTAFQNVEYVTSQNYDRRAFDRLNCIAVVPGATGAWRRQCVLDAGGYSAQTLTEDADLTLAILSRGGRIVYAPDARSVTEAPVSHLALFRQRFRWSFGTLQCLWKHRGCLFHGTLGWVALPNMLLFQIFFPILSPLGDLILILCLLRHDYMAVAGGYLAFLAMDLVGSAIAFRLDRQPLAGIWVVLVQRFYYRQFMYFVTFAALLASLRGRRHGWNKLQRAGSVNMPAPQTAAV